MKNSKIEWCHHSVNLWWGCVKVSAACLHCYAETLAKLFSRGRASWGPNGLRWIRTTAALRELRKLDKDARKRGVVERVFVNSMSDTFEDRRDLDDPRALLFYVAASLTNLQLLLLTKRPANIRRMVPGLWLEQDGWPTNVWIGTTVENQAMANERISVLLNVPAPVRFLSMEPLLGPVDLCDVQVADVASVLGGEWDRLGMDREPFRGVRGRLDATTNQVWPEGAEEKNWLGGVPSIGWVIVGGESGAGSRPMHPSWAADLRDQCEQASVPYFFKQWGESIPAGMAIARNLQGSHQYVRRHEDCQAIPHLMFRVGKKDAGRELNGRLHDAVPTP